MNEKVCGFLILRVPAGMDQADVYDHGFKIEDKVYNGIERPHLYDLRKDYIEKELPPELSLMIERNLHESQDDLFLEMIKSLSDAEQLLQYSKQKNIFIELIAIESDIINQLKGTISIDSKKIEWLGYDAFLFGGGSLLLNGLFLKPSFFEKWVRVINKDGLFFKKEEVNEYAKDYFRLAEKNIVEDHIPSPYGFDAVRVGRVLL